MIRIKRLIALALVIGLLLQTAGCWSQKQFEDIGFILQMGIETSPNGKILMSITVPVVEQGVKSQVEVKDTSSERLIRPSRENMRNEFGKMLQGGKIQNLYFSEELARKGIHEFLEVFLRDPENPLLANMLVVEGSPRAMMEVSRQYRDKPRPAIYVTNLLKDAHQRSTAPEARIFNFSIQYYSETIDPIAVLVSYDEKDINIKGTALFDRDRMVGKIDTAQTALLNALRGRKERFDYTYEGDVPSENEGNIKRGATISINSVKRQVEIGFNGRKPVIRVRLRLQTSLDEDAGPHATGRAKTVKVLEETFANSMKNDIRKLLEQLRDMGSDPIGFGEIVRAKHNSIYRSVNWKEIYRSAEFEINVKVNIEDYGTIK